MTTFDAKECNARCEEAADLLTEVIGCAASRQQYGIGEPLFAKLARIRVLLSDVPVREQHHA